MMIGMTMSYQGHVHPISLYSPRLMAMTTMMVWKGLMILFRTVMYLRGGKRSLVLGMQVHIERQC